jgi:hypothetical protein
MVKHTLRRKTKSKLNQAPANPNIFARVYSLRLFPL